MRKWFYTGFYMIMVSLTLASCTVSQKISDTNQSSVAEMVENKNFIFKAERVIAQNGFTKTLTTDYDLSISPDTIKARLPYFGRAYRVPMNLTGGGIQFVSTKFSYSSTVGKKQMWEIKIIPKEQNTETDDLRLSISPSGNVTLIVMSTHRQSITFYGKIEEPSGGSH